MKDKFLESLKKKKSLRLILLALGGMFSGLILVFPELGFLQWLAMVPAGVVIIALASDRDVRLRALYGYGLFYFMCYYPVVYHWFANLYPLDFISGMTPASALAVVLAGVFGLSLLQALMGGLVFVTLGILFRSRFVCKRQLLKPFVAGGVWAVFEWTQTLGWIGVPWGRLALGQSEYIVGIQTASLFGSYFISFLIVAVNFCISLGILNLAEGMVSPIKIPCLCVAVMLAFQYGAGTLIYILGGNGTEGEPVTVAAVQGNISSNEKWSISSNRKTFEVYRKYSIEAAKAGADIILWPESAIPYSLEEDQFAHDYVSTLAAECGVPIVAGGFMDADERGDAEYNALVCFMPDGSVTDNFYGKRHLVPFGEYVPMEKLISVLIPPLSGLVMGGYTIVPGEGAQLMEINGLNIGSLICFDSIYEGLTLESVREGAEVIFLSTNDSWFTDSAALDMHNSQARLRAVESGRYVVRAANTGISSIITPRGQVTQKLCALEAGYIMGEVYERDSRTLYSYIGNLFIYILIACFLWIIVYEKIILNKILKKRKD